MLHQVASESIGGRVGQEHDTLGKTVAGAVHVRLLYGGVVRAVQLSVVHLHESALFPQASDGPDVVQGFPRDLWEQAGRKSQDQWSISQVGGMVF